MHSLVNLLVPDGVPNTELCPMEEIWGSFEDALIFISHTVSQTMILNFKLILKNWVVLCIRNYIE